MGLVFNGIDIYEINFNNISLTKLIFNGDTIWESLQDCVVTGDAEEDSILTATTVPNTYQTLCSYQWYRSISSGTTGTAISGATSSTYTITNEDRTYYLYCVATISNVSVTSNYIGAIIGWHTVDSISWEHESDWSNGNYEKSIGTFTYNNKTFKLKQVKMIVEINTVGTWLGGCNITASSVTNPLAHVGNAGTYTWSGEGNPVTSTSFTMGTFSGDGRQRKTKVQVEIIDVWE